MCAAKRHVCFTPNSDIKCDIMECPLAPNSDTANAGDCMQRRSNQAQAPMTASRDSAALKRAPNRDTWA